MRILPYIVRILGFLGKSGMTRPTGPTGPTGPTPLWLLGCRNRRANASSARSGELRFDEAHDEPMGGGEPLAIVPSWARAIWIAPLRLLMAWKWTLLPTI
jgi:hypothetical protein